MNLSKRKRCLCSLVNKNYNRGRNFEHRVKKFFEELGFFVVRSAGSKGAADLVVIKQDCSGLCCRVGLVQCKYGCGYINKAELERLKKLCNDLLAAGYVAITDKHGHIRFKLINDFDEEELEIFERQVEE